MQMHVCIHRGVTVYVYIHVYMDMYIYIYTHTRGPSNFLCGFACALNMLMAPHSSTVAWRIPWMEEPGGLQSMGSLSRTRLKRLHFHFSLSCIGEGNGNPLQCSCLENPRDGGAWWAAVYGVAQSRIRLKRLSSCSSRSVFLSYL